MASKWETRVGQLRLIDGIRQESPANIGVAERRSWLSLGQYDKGQLYVLIELSGQSFGREEQCRELVAAVTQEYLRTPGTVTYGLRQAVLLANAQLTRTNVQVSSEHRLGGIACVVLRNGEIFVAQAGWPMVYLVQRDQVKAFPDTILEDEEASILGQRPTTQVRLFHSAVQPGNMILMVDSPMARQLGITRIGQVMGASIDQAMQNIEAMAPAEDCSAVVIQVGGAAAAPGDSQAERWAFMAVEQPEAASPTSFDDTPAVARAQPSRQMVVRQEMWDDQAASADVDDWAAQETWFEPEPQAAFETESDMPHTPPSARSTSGPAGAPWLAQAQSVFQNVVKGVSGGARALGERVLPDRRPEEAGAARQTQQRTQQRRRNAARSRRRGEESPQSKWWIAVAIAIPLLALLFVGGYKLYHDWAQRSQLQARLEALRSKRSAAVSHAESPMVARDEWLQVIDLADQALALQPDQAEAIQVRTLAETEIDRIDGVTRLGTPARIFNYTAAGSSPTRVIVAGLDVYVLDRGGGFVYRHSLNELRNALRNPNAEQVLVQRGQPVQGQNLGNLVDMAWMKDGGERQAGALLILDANGLLLEYDPTWSNFQAQTMGGRDQWRSPTAIRTYDSNLYVLDPQANQIFKYTRRQFTAAPARWFTDTGIKLAQAIDLGIDGSIVVLHSDGKIAKYMAGAAATFTVTRMPSPLSAADALYMDIPEIAQSIYIADRSEGRIVQLGRDGVFVRQFKSARSQESVFGQLSGIFVDEAGAKLYYVAVNALYVADMPLARQ